MEKNSPFVSYEHILAGLGLNRLDQILNQRNDRSPADILAAAEAGDLQAKEVGNQLAGFAGQAFGDFALMNMALGGLSNWRRRKGDDAISKERQFQKNFYQRGQFSDIMKKISVQVILDDFAALKAVQTIRLFYLVNKFLYQQTSKKLR